MSLPSVSVQYYLVMWNEDKAHIYLKKIGDDCYEFIDF